MSKKSNLPAAVHDHFRKANALHGYVEKSLGEASKHALETGQELLLAKKAVPHGSWEAECERLFDGSLRTAQFYMSFAKDASKLKSATPVALLLDNTLVGAAKAARDAVRPKPPPKPKPAPEPEPEEPDDEPEEGYDEPPWDDSPKKAKAPKTPPRQFDRSHWLKQWDNSIGPLCRLVDKIAENVGESHCPSHDAIQSQLQAATDEITEWMGK